MRLKTGVKDRDFCYIARPRMARVLAFLRKKRPMAIVVVKRIPREGSDHVAK